MFALLFALICGVSLARDHYRSVGFTPLDQGIALTTELKVNEETDTITITLSGPAAVYYSVAFGSHTMKDAWSVVVTGDGHVFEQKLDDHQAGTLLESSFTVVSNEVSGKIRTVELTRSVMAVLGSDYHTFIPSATKVKACYAFGKDADYTYHGENCGSSDIEMEITQIEFPSLQKGQKEKAEGNKYGAGAGAAAVDAASDTQSDDDSVKGQLIVFRDDFMRWWTASPGIFFSVVAVCASLVMFAIWRYYLNLKKSSLALNYHALSGIEMESDPTTPLIV